jgi:uncharacterized protein YbjT (DUF2867 family)
MKYVLTGAAGNITRPLALELLKAGHQVTVVGRHAENLKELSNAGATTAIGSVDDEAFLTKTFTGADALYLMVPPNFGAADMKGFIASIGHVYVKSVAAAAVKNLVVLSSVGAELPKGSGPIDGLYQVEQALQDLKDVNILFLRAGYFYQNLLANIGLIKHAGIIGSNFSVADNKFLIVHPEDIAAAAAKALQSLSFKGHEVEYVVSDAVSTAAIAKEIGGAIGKTDLPWIQFEDAQAQDGMEQAGLSKEIATNYVEMGQALNSGRLSQEFYKRGDAVTGKIKLKDFAKEFAAVYNAN